MPFLTLCSAALFAAASCVADPTAPTMTPAQQLYLAEVAYVAAVEQAAAYREQCDAKPEVLQGTCRHVVGELQAIDREAEPVFERAIEALETGNGDGMALAATGIAAVKARLEQRLAEALLEEAKKPVLDKVPLSEPIAEIAP